MPNKKEKHPPLWSDERLRTEIDRTDQWADAMALYWEIRNEYEAKLQDLRGEIYFLQQEIKRDSK